jgi:hypothetical protein
MLTGLPSKRIYPEFRSKPTSPHPLFHRFVRAGLERRESRKADSSGKPLGIMASAS